MKKGQQVLVLGGWILTFQLIGILMGQLTQTNLNPWYYDLTKSPLTPPDITFGIVWTILYVFLSIIGWQLFHCLKHVSKSIKYLFGTQMLLNWAWTPVFFGLHHVFGALIILMLMVVLGVPLLIGLIRQRWALGVLYLIYWVWLCFATYLNGCIWHAMHV
jgi:translocator protein